MLVRWLGWQINKFISIKLNKIQLKQLAVYFIDLSKVWFISGAIDFFLSKSFNLTSLSGFMGGATASFVFLLIGLIMLDSQKQI